ncbi:TPA: hypothetical protein R0C45_004098 [Kluyvera ascorbata F0526]|nr:hypothetical protein [Kluyvera ascorbata F0526]
MENVTYSIEMDPQKSNNAANLTQLVIGYFGNKWSPQAAKVISGKLGFVFSAASVLDKYSRGEDTISDWLGLGSYVALMLAGYTGNPIIAGVATVLGIASFLTSDNAASMAKAYVDASLK